MLHAERITKVKLQNSLAVVSGEPQDSHVLIAEIASGTWHTVTGDAANEIGELSRGGRGDSILVSDGHSLRCQLNVRSGASIDVATYVSRRLKNSFSMGNVRISPDETAQAVTGTFILRNIGTFIGALIRVRNAEASILHRIERAEGQVVWNHAGTRVAYTRIVERPDSGYMRELWVRDLDTDRDTQLTNGNWDAHVSWSPDGQWLVFQRGVKPFEANDIYIVRSTGGSHPQKLEVRMSRARLPAWCR